MVLVTFCIAIRPTYALVRLLPPGSWDEGIVASAIIPDILASRRTPLDALATARIVSNLKSGAGLGNISSFCEDAGFVCNQTIDEFPVLLHSLGPYDPEPDLSARSSNHNDSSKDMDLDLFFGEGQLVSGNKISLSMQPKPFLGRAFLPRALEKELPFSCHTLPKLLALFNFTNTSNLAWSMAETLKVCEAKAREDETKACVASLESMEEFAAFVIGTKALEILVSSQIEGSMKEQMLIVKDVIEMEAARRGAVACHNAMFPYQVFYCHQLWGSRLFKVQLQSNEGEVVKVVASCHQESKLGNLSKKALGKLKVQRLGDLICHWNLDDNVVWIPAAAMATDIY